MRDIYFLVLLVLTGLGSAYIATILPRVKARLSTLFKRKQPKITTSLENMASHKPEFTIQLNKDIV